MKFFISSLKSRSIYKYEKAAKSSWPSEKPRCVSCSMVRRISLTFGVKFTSSL